MCTGSVYTLFLQLAAALESTKDEKSAADKKGRAFTYLQ